ncbi:hypothetical protein [Flavobacterium sp. TAB 87]|uniref:hypothetical protein n=1 Tax=Flavobacterium sp. TAB 87 TaxID=1729581 RepID=UPI00076DD190|nr:hypothetical protein [Flavobacterium sp. TAB 87]KVV14836.1 hypothetical protein AP058_01892 [Flavobacterium sp. TAB 87]
MKATKTKPPVVYGDHLPITPFQIKRIMNNCNYLVEMKNEWVQWVTEDNSRTSLKSITQAQAVKIIKQQTGEDPKQELKTIVQGGRSHSKSNWALFDSKNKQHLGVMANLRTLQWTVPSERHGEVADLERLSNFLKSDLSPVKKPLKKMEPWEVSKIIECFKSMITKKYK